MISPGDLKTLIVRAFLETGKDSTVPDLAKRAGVSESTIRKALNACHGAPDGCQARQPGCIRRPAYYYGPTRETLRVMLLAAGYQFTNESAP